MTFGKKGTGRSCASTWRSVSPLAALHQYNALKRLLRDALGIAPSEATRQVAGQIAQRLGLFDADDYVPAKAASIADVVASETPPSPSPISGSLPVFLTQFFGRENEMRLLMSLLRPASALASVESADESGGTLSSAEEAGGLSSADQMVASRLATLTGPGGTGKTRLAVELARRLRPAYQENICFVPLADLIDPRRIPEAIATALGLLLASGTDRFAQVVEALSGRPCLLVLDNFEQLVDGGRPVIAALLEQVPTLTCLLTSRRSLGLDGEREVFVAPLPVPVTDGEGTQAFTLLSCPSVRLLVDRVQASMAHFHLTPNNAADVAALCRRLEGIPLAIELAATRARVLTPGQILAQLEHGFDLLVNRRADKEIRHRSLRAALKWSWQLLTPESRRLFARLSIFRGGWSLEAAQEICQEPYVLEGLEQLHADSLILVEETLGEQRFRMLETVREFAQTQWLDPEQDALTQRHACYFLQIVEQAAPHLEEADYLIWRERLTLEYDNLLAAMDWAVRTRKGEVALRLAAGLARYWQMRYSLKEALEWLNRALALCPDMQTSARARALGWAGYYAAYLGDHAQSRAWYDECLALRRALEDKPGIAEARNGLGILAYYQQDAAAALASWEESLALWREIGDVKQIALLLHNLALGYQQQGEHAHSRTLLEESLALRRTLPFYHGLCHSLESLADLLRREGKYAEARTLYAEALGLVYARQDRSFACRYLIRIARLLAEEGQPARAAQLLAATHVLHKSLASLSQPNERAVQEECARESVPLCDRLGKEAFDREWKRGLALTLEEAVSLATQT